MPSQVWRLNNASVDLGSALGFMGSAVAIFDGALNVLALSPLDNFFTTHAAADTSMLGVGVSARVDALPPGFTSRTIILGDSGINDTVFALGSALLAVGGKPRLSVQDVEDISLKYISLWSDNGAYCTLEALEWLLLFAVCLSMCTAAVGPPHFHTHTHHHHKYHHN